MRLTVGRAVEPRLGPMTARCSASQSWRALAGDSAGLHKMHALVVGLHKMHALVVGLHKMHALVVGLHTDTNCV